MFWGTKDGKVMRRTLDSAGLLEWGSPIHKLDSTESGVDAFFDFPAPNVLGFLSAGEFTLLEVDTDSSSTTRTLHVSPPTGFFRSFSFFPIPLVLAENIHRGGIHFARAIAFGENYVLFWLCRGETLTCYLLERTVPFHQLVSSFRRVFTAGGLMGMSGRKIHAF